MYIKHYHVLERTLSRLIWTADYISAVVSLWYRNSITRAQLTHLSTEQLEDIGISEYDAQCEAEKAFWE